MAHFFMGLLNHDPLKTSSTILNTGYFHMNQRGILKCNEYLHRILIRVIPSSNLVIQGALLGTVFHPNA